MSKQADKKRNSSTTKKDEFSVILQYDRDSGLYSFGDANAKQGESQNADASIKNPNKRAQRTKKKEAMAGAGLQYAMTPSGPAAANEAGAEQSKNIIIQAASSAGGAPIHNQNLNPGGPPVASANQISSTTKPNKKAPNTNADQSNLKNQARKGQDDDVEMNMDIIEKHDIDENNDFENAYQAKTDEDAEEKLLIEIEKQYQKQSFIIPSCAQWFDFSTIHEIEMQSLPEFFCDKFPHKNPQTYLNYRNYIIKMYRENPNAYLPATECRKKLPGDICSIIRLHAFLEHWGLINFNVEPYLIPAKIQLGDSGNVSAQVIEAAAKGYINVAEAKAIQSIFDKRTRGPATAESGAGPGDEGDSKGPQNNLFIIAAQKIKAISSSYAPICNFCGNVCDNKQWYRKVPPQDSFQNEGELALKYFKEKNSIHDTLKKLTSTYLICKECFSLENYPKILQASDFEKTSLQNMLMIGCQSAQLTQSRNSAEDNGDEPAMIEGDHDEEGSDEYKNLTKNFWNEEELERLVDGIAEHQNDWEAISKEVFDEMKSPEQCVQKFLELPITENMMAKISKRSDQNNTQAQQNTNAKQSQQACPSVLMDTSNPLFSQVAIFARCLEERQNRIEELQQQQQTLEAQQQIGGNIGGAARRSGAGRQGLAADLGPQPVAPPIEKRTTRRMHRQMKDKTSKDKSQDIAANDQSSSKQPEKSDEQLYLIDPSQRADLSIPDEVLDKIADKAILRSKRLAKRARKDIESEMNKVIFEQMQKLEMKFDYLRQFWQLIEGEKKDLQIAREECLAERVALSALKSGNYRNNESIEKSLWQNQFASGQSLIEKMEK